MKGKLNWQSKKVVNIFDEATLWSAPFGRMLLDNIPMKSKSTVLDIGFGTGFPLIELSQRFGEDTTVYGIDVWKEGINKAKEKINVLGINNIQIFEQSAVNIPLADLQMDLITSNLGINNFEDKEKIIKECCRVLKKGSSICITTNPIGTFDEVFSIFNHIFTEMNLVNSKKMLDTYINNRGTKESIINLFEASGSLSCIKTIKEDTNIRFANASSILNHSLIRVGFLEGWENLVLEKHQKTFFKTFESIVQKTIDQKGEFMLSIPMLYLEFVRE